MVANTLFLGWLHRWGSWLFGSCQPGFTDLITLDLLMICCFSQEIHLRNRVLVVPGSSWIANPDTCFGGPGFSGELEVCLCS